MLWAQKMGKLEGLISTFVRSVFDKPDSKKNNYK